MRGVTEWEYNIHVAPATRPSLVELNKLGGNGWELASTVGVGELGATEEIWYKFKRPGGLETSTCKESHVM